MIATATKMPALEETQKTLRVRRLSLDGKVQLSGTTLWFALGRVFSGGVAILPLPQNHDLRSKKKGCGSRRT